MSNATPVPSQNDLGLMEGLMDFHSDEARALLQKYRHVEHLIGCGHHGSSEGEFCEDLLRQFLRQVVPGRYSVDQGFIRHTARGAGVSPSCVSKQLDVIIHDSHDYAPLFRSGEFVVVLPKSVVAVIEVKKTLNKDKLEEALENLAQANEVLLAAERPLLKIFTGVFAFTSVDDLRPENKPYSDSFHTSFHTIARTYAPSVCIPDVLIVADKDIFFREEIVGLPQPSVVYPPFALSHTAAEHQAAGHGRVNIAVQAFLSILYAKVRFPETESSSRRFVFPDDLIHRTVIPFFDPSTPVTNIFLPPKRCGE
jgi:hypothetical protein